MTLTAFMSSVEHAVLKSRYQVGKVKTKNDSN